MAPPRCANKIAAAIHNTQLILCADKAYIRKLTRHHMTFNDPNSAILSPIPCSLLRRTRPAWTHRQLELFSDARSGSSVSMIRGFTKRAVERGGHRLNLISYSEQRHRQSIENSYRQDAAFTSRSGDRLYDYMKYITNVCRSFDLACGCDISNMSQHRAR